MLFINTVMIIHLLLLHHVTAISAGYIHNDKQNIRQIRQA